MFSSRATPFQTFRIVDLSLFDLLIAVVFCLWLVWFGTTHPLGNWDLVGYTALVQKILHPDLNLAELHALTWSSLERAMSPDIVHRLQTASPYAQSIAASPDALGQQLPFYRPRVLFAHIAAVVHQLMGLEVPLASVAVSGLFAALTLVVLFREIRMTYPAVLAWAMVALVFLFLKLGLFARISSPDTLAGFLGLMTLVFCLERRFGYFVLFGVLMVLARHDTVLLAGLLCLTGTFHLLRSVIALLCLCVVFLALSHWSQWYGWGTLFLHTFVSPMAFPASGEVSFNVLSSAYAHQWFKLVETLFLDFNNPMPVGILVPLLILWHRSGDLTRRICAVLIASILVKIVLFPAVDGHWFRLYLIEIMAVLMIILRNLHIKG